ncbi:MAG TPA: copper-binding protein [Phenylobacterium sp.]|jgi:Cu(I)/Ag(I) efflux system protein CusF|nr:copper-binding protein [Phenylobacterium sp.]
MKSLCVSFAAVVILAVAGSAAAAQSSSGAAVTPPAHRTAQGTGVVTEIDLKGDTVTLKHQPIPAFGWPSMTMPFRVTPPSLLKGLKVGEKIDFDTNEGNGLPEITAIRKP